ncbi:uncharacterized protein LOC122320280 [Drosophila ficusphila]|uniref:uncharacterized protein LOC122320280 n=1 Tax=Drosophila ficusphila TaxID=30025 RepID=UPI001C896042|nr:uncharacterized protein LOC122320280 [Drosophila ficusphila]
MPERQLVKVVKKGLRDGVARFVYAMEIFTVDELRQECIEVERSFGRRGRTSYQPPLRHPAGDRPRVAEACVPEPQEDSFDVDEMRGRPRNPFRTGCWNCGAADHGFRDCESVDRKLFCYRCGRPDTVLPKCPDCAENDRLGDPKAGGNRPERNPAK